MALKPTREGGMGSRRESKRCDHCLAVKSADAFATWTTCRVCDDAKRAERKARREAKGK